METLLKNLCRHSGGKLSNVKKLGFGQEVLSSESNKESKLSPLVDPTVELAEERMEDDTPHNPEPTVDGPILLVCYTNHALDQFLEGILEFSNPDGRYLSHYRGIISHNDLAYFSMYRVQTDVSCEQTVQFPFCFLS